MSTSSATRASARPLRAVGLLITVGLVSVVLCSACSWIVGDSITVGSRTALTRRFPGWNVRAAGRRALDQAGLPDLRWPDWDIGLDAIRQSVDQMHAGDWIVVELGTNDVLRGHSVRDWTWDIRTALARIPKDLCVAWVLPFVSNQQDRTDAFGESVKEAIVDRSCAVTIDWPIAVRADPALVFDGIHPTPHGASVLSGLILQAVRSVQPVE